MNDVIKQRIPNAALDEAEVVLKEALADIEARYRREAEPFIQRLAEIEAMRQYRYILVPKAPPS